MRSVNDYSLSGRATLRGLVNVSAVHLALFYTAYVLAGGFGQGLALIPGVSIIFWPPAGIFLATLLLNHRSSWPWWIITGCLAELTCNAIWFHNAVPFALIYFSANALEALTAAWLIGRFAPKPFRLATLTEVVAFVLLGAIIAPMVGATVIATTDAWLGKHPFATTWPLVWLGDGSGLLISMPLTLVAVQTWRERANIPVLRLVEAAVLIFILLGVGALALSGYLPTVYLTLPPLLWAVLRFQLQGAATALGLITLLTAFFTITGEGEFSGHPDLQHGKIVMLQTFLGVAAVSALIVAALSQLYQQALLNLRTINRDLEERVAERTATLQESEARLRQLAAELSDADRRKNEFLATLAHELRNPLAPLHNGLELIKLAGDNHDMTAQARSLMERQLLQLVRLVDDLMDVSRITRGMIELKTTPVPLAAVLDSALETSRPLIEQMGHKLTVTLPEQPVMVNADLTRLAQVFVNLLNNSAKYMERDGRIELIAVCQDDEIVVSVCDSGIGIPAGELTRIFEMFSQVDHSLEKRQGGLGIGLTLVKQLVELHGGSIEARSEGPGRGAEFVVRLPVAAAAAEAADIEPAAAAAPAAAQRILIVDDNRDAADSLATILQSLGHEISTVYDGQAGLERAGQIRPDAVLLDIGLPELNGYEVCRRLREQPWGKQLIVIAVTGWGQDEDRRRSREAGFDHHLVKPVDAGILLELLKNQ